MKKVSFLLLLILFFLFFVYKKSTDVPVTTFPSGTIVYRIKTGPLNELLNVNNKGVLRPQRLTNGDYLVLDETMDGRTAIVPIGTMISISFPVQRKNLTPQAKVISVMPKGIIGWPGGIYHLPPHIIGFYKVVSSGVVVIAVKP